MAQRNVDIAQWVATLDDRFQYQESLDHATRSATAERNDGARRAADHLVGRGSEQRQVDRPPAPHTYHDHIGVPISRHSKNFLVRLAENDRFVDATPGSLVPVREFMQGAFGTVALVTSECRYVLGLIRRKRVAP